MMPEPIYATIENGIRYSVDGKGIITTSSGAMEITIHPSGTFDVRYDDVSIPCSDDGTMFSVDGRPVIRISRNIRCGGSGMAVEDTDGNIIFRISRWLGNMCSGIKIETPSGTVLTDTTEDYSVEGETAVTESTIVSADGTVIRRMTRRSIPAGGNA